MKANRLNAGAGGTPALLSPFAAFMRWSEWLHARTGRTDSIALVRLMELLFEFLTGELDQPRRKPPPRCGAITSAAAGTTSQAFSKTFCRQTHRQLLSTAPAQAFPNARPATQSGSSGDAKYSHLRRCGGSRQFCGDPPAPAWSSVVFHAVSPGFFFLLEYIGSRCSCLSSIR